MAGRRIAGIIILILGVIGLIISVFANMIAIGPLGRDPGFGMQQIAGTVIGVIFIAVGALLSFKK
jgi:hypothetical protein